METKCSDLLFTDNKGKFKLPGFVVNQMHQYRQVKSNTPESGGLLLGRFILNSPDVVVDEITTPLPTDRRSRFRFRRGSYGHQQVINDRWFQSDGTCNYLGEWHTHPEPNPVQSTRDIASWQMQLDRLPDDQDELFFAIIGTSSIAVWKALRQPFSYHQLIQLP